MMEMLEFFPAKCRRKIALLKSSIRIAAISRVCFGAITALTYFLKKRKPKTPFFILCAHRTGSHHFIDYINSSPGASFGYEIFGPYQPYGLGRWKVSKKTAFRHVRHFLNWCRQPVCGVKIFFSHLQRMRISLDDLLKEFPEARWVVLYRKDILAQYLSYEIASQSHQWFRLKTSEPPQSLSIVFDPEKALIYRDRVKSWYRGAMNSKDLCDRAIWLSYEELVRDPQKLFDDKVFPFLKLPSSPVQTCFIKQNGGPVSEKIANYTEVKDFIQNTDFTQNYDAVKKVTVFRTF